MTTEEFAKALNDRGIETEIDSDGIVVMLLLEKEFEKRSKYVNIVLKTGWNRSWGMRVKGEK